MPNTSTAATCHHQHQSNRYPLHLSQGQRWLDATPQIVFGRSLISGQPLVMQSAQSADVYGLAAPSLSTQLSGMPGVGSNESYANAIHTSTERELQAKIYNIDEKTQAYLDKTNEKLSKDGKPPVDIISTTKEIEAITNNSSLTDKEKKSQIDAIRKRLGLSKGQMKKLFTKRLAKIYKEVKQHLQQTLNGLKSDVAQAEKLYGKNSPQAQEATRRLEAFQKVNEPLMQKLDQNAKLYNSMYPSFWSKLGGVFKKIGKVFSKIMNVITPILAMIPGVGQVIAGAWTAVKGIYQLARGKFGNFLSSMMGALPLIGAAGGAIGKMAETAYRWGNIAIGGVKSVTAVAKGNFLEALSYAGGALGGVAESGLGAISSGAAKAAPWIDTGLGYYQMGREAYQTVTGGVKTWWNQGWNSLFEALFETRKPD